VIFPRGKYTLNYYYANNALLQLSAARNNLVYICRPRRGTAKVKPFDGDAFCACGVPLCAAQSRPRTILSRRFGCAREALPFFPPAPRPLLPSSFTLEGMKDSAAGMKDSTSLNRLLARIGAGSFSSAGRVKVSSAPTSRQAENNSSRSSPLFAAFGAFAPTIIPR
jgi:hypothetical protein